MKTTEVIPPKRLSVHELQKAGVEWDGDLHHLVFVCQQCGIAWTPQLRGFGRMPKGYWKCPNGCNSIEYITGFKSKID